MPGHLFPCSARAPSWPARTLALIVSDRLYADIAHCGGLLNPATYQQIHVTNNETRRARARSGSARARTTTSRISSD
jgi:hypothetical protein